MLFPRPSGVVSDAGIASLSRAEPGLGHARLEIGSVLIDFPDGNNSGFSISVDRVGWTCHLGKLR